MVTAYLNGSFESFNLVHQLDDREIAYEAKNVVDAKEIGFTNLPVLVVGSKVMTYKKAMKWLKKQGGRL